MKNFFENVSKTDIAKCVIGGVTATAVAVPMFRLFQGYYNPEKFYINEGEPLYDEDDLIDDEEDYDEE